MAIEQNTKLKRHYVFTSTTASPVMTDFSRFMDVLLLVRAPTRGCGGSRDRVKKALAVALSLTNRTRSLTRHHHHFILSSYSPTSSPLPRLTSVAPAVAPVEHTGMSGMEHPDQFIAQAVAFARPDPLAPRRGGGRVQPDVLEHHQRQQEIVDPYALTPAEKIWVGIQPALHAAGYSLRERYRPGWVGSWIGTNKNVRKCEDSLAIGDVPTVLDAVRMCDKAQVVMKLWSDNPRDGPERLALSYFSQPERATDPSNHCVPLLDCIPFPGDGEGGFEAILVEPLLRDWREPPSQMMVVEALSFMNQLIEGLEHMHMHDIAHGDLHPDNIMMDPNGMFPDGFHGAFNWDLRARRYDQEHNQTPKRTRLQTYVKYYFIDFGSSVQIAEGAKPLVKPGWTGWLCPEMVNGHESGPALYDPFKADVYALGLTLLTEIQEHRGLEFVIPSLIGMIAQNPDDRPTMSEVKVTFRHLITTLSSRQLRQRIRGLDEEDPLLDLEDNAAYLKLWWQSFRHGFPEDIRRVRKKGKASGWTSSWKMTKEFSPSGAESSAMGDERLSYHGGRAATLMKALHLTAFS